MAAAGCLLACFSATHLHRRPRSRTDPGCCLQLVLSSLLILPVSVRPAASCNHPGCDMPRAGGMILSVHAFPPPPGWMMRMMVSLTCRWAICAECVGGVSPFFSAILATVQTGSKTTVIVAGCT